MNPKLGLLCISVELTLLPLLNILLYLCDSRAIMSTFPDVSKATLAF